MKKHCKVIAVTGMILGIAGILYMTWLYNYSLLRLLIWVVGLSAVYMVYVMWSSLAEILERLERLDRKAFGDTIGEKLPETEGNEHASDVDEDTGEKEADVQAVLICPRCGNIQQVGTAICAQCGMSLK